uniref:TYR_PHOSPHATASE_2 domain-containing protein n=1 Tax=Panagrellus redivivus TaxID=6233 RepID=A0A7E4V4G4_PANRE
MVRTNRKFPENWENVKPIGEIIEGTRFLVFKTPIDTEPGLKLNREKLFTTANLLRELTFRQQQLGLVINLSFTSKYYDPRVFECICSYKHIHCNPAGYTRREDIVKRFINTVESFLNKNKENDLLIGVHCSDGINRSGYLICRYLIDRLHMGSDAALDAFEKARGHTIERGSCVQALYRAVAERRNRDVGSPYDAPDGEDDRSKRKRKAPPAEAIRADEVMQQLAALEQQFSGESPALAQQTPPTWGTPDQLEGSSSIGPRAVPKRDAEGEYYEEEEEEYEEEVIDESGEVSISKRRRLRRAKLNKKFNVMRSGNFAAIQEVLKEQ